MLFYSSKPSSYVYLFDLARIIKYNIREKRKLMIRIIGKNSYYYNNIFFFFIPTLRHWPNHYFVSCYQQHTFAIVSDKAKITYEYTTEDNIMTLGSEGEMQAILKNNNKLFPFKEHRKKLTTVCRGINYSFSKLVCRCLITFFFCKQASYDKRHVYKERLSF